MKFVALLRGINVGGNKKVPMAELKKVMEKEGLNNVRTLLNSGNVVFEAAGKGDAIRKKLETIIENTFGFPVPVIIRTHEQIVKLVESDPFKKIKVDADTRLYISFLGDEKKKSSLKLPYVSAKKEFTILAEKDGIVISVLQLSPSIKTPDAMGILEKEWGKNITTRNWNTVEKIANL